MVNQENKNKYIRLFNSEDGKAVLKDLMKLHYISSTTFSDSSFRTAFNEGQRSVVVRILRIIGKLEDE